MSTLILRKLNDETLAEAVSAVAQAFGIPAGQILAHRRTPEICDARHALCRILREETDGTFQGIGRRLNRDHGSIMHGATRAAELVEIDRHYAAKYEAAHAAFTSTGPRHRWPWL